jgi:hypothetical protein
VQIPVTTIDAEVERLNLSVGFIKADIEDSEELMLGARRTLERQRPILSTAIYHSGHQLMRVPKLVQEMGGYHLEFRLEQGIVPGSTYGASNLCELRLFAIPVGVS